MDHPHSINEKKIKSKAVLILNTKRKPKKRMTLLLKVL
jgi:hypothetical protein